MPPIREKDIYIQGGYTAYPPAVLLLADSGPETLELQHNLENEGYQVNQVNVSALFLVALRQLYFEAIVVDLEHVEPDRLKEVCHTLKTAAELHTAPIIMLITRSQINTCPGLLEIPAAVHYLFKNKSLQTRLKQTIEQIHYLTSRYVAM